MTHSKPPVPLIVATLDTISVLCASKADWVETQPFVRLDAPGCRYSKLYPTVHVHPCSHEE